MSTYGHRLIPNCFAVVAITVVCFARMLLRAYDTGLNINRAKGKATNTILFVKFWKVYLMWKMYPVFLYTTTHNTKRKSVHKKLCIFFVE